MEIVIPIIILGVIAVIAGIGLAIASKVMAVPVDEKCEAITEILPGANCGACGFSGCSGYAAALSSGKTANTALCNPGGNEVSKKIAEYLGLAAGDVVPTAAVVFCQGNIANAQLKMNYSGVQSCRMASQLFGGDKACIYGCVGLGDCVRECPYDAIHICDGVARINPAVCRGCTKCVSTCPKGLIEMVPLGKTAAAVLCKNKDKGALTRKECSAGCIGCTKCAKVCPSGAVSIENSLSRVNNELCTACGMCADACPTKSIEIITVTDGSLKKSDN